MKIVKSDIYSPLNSLQIWLIPLIATILVTQFGDIIPGMEWVWYSFSPLAFIVWLFLNWRIKKG